MFLVYFLNVLTASSLGKTQFQLKRENSVGGIYPSKTVQNCLCLLCRLCRLRRLCRLCRLCRLRRLRAICAVSWYIVPPPLV